MVASVAQPPTKAGREVFGYRNRPDRANYTGIDLASDVGRYRA